MKLRMNTRTIIMASVFVSLCIGSIVIYKFINGVRKLVPNKKASEYYSEDQYYGIVMDKFIDREQHNYKTIIIRNENYERSVLFDFEIGGLYEFIEIGDSISKNVNSLDFQLVREGLDTIMPMKVN